MMMNKTFLNSLHIIMSLMLIGIVTSCDDGRIYEKDTAYKEGKTVQIRGVIHGLETWEDNSYYVAAAGFDNNSEYAVISKIINTTDEDGQVNITLSGIDENVNTVELCVLNRLRQRVATFAVHEMTETETSTMDIGELNVGRYHTIQSTLFDQSCIACHGGSGFAAAGLHLTEGNSYAAIVNVPSKKIEGKNIVTPGDKDNSVLHLLLNTDLSSTWRQNHSDMLNKERTSNLLRFIDDWIANGAKE